MSNSWYDSWENRQDEKFDDMNNDNAELEKIIFGVLSMNLSKPIALSLTRQIIAAIATRQLMTPRF